ncbi:MAG: glycosyltransferase family 2 protein [Parachlamydiaceae bacterium]|nr:glycosyltransferase family 2 protein [Parachlamydiaceae bacterium]
MGSSNVAVIVVTHNSEKHLDKCMQCLNSQTLQASQIVLVDSGSADRTYLNKFASMAGVDVVLAEKDIGFCKGNNIGLTKITPDVDFILFINPDAFAMPTFLEEAVAFMLLDSQKTCGALTGTTAGYSIESDFPTGLYDTTGVFCTWWGCWYDRGQGEAVNSQLYSSIEEIPAICGAVYFCRRIAVRDVMLPGEELFDSRFYMYKEDIDLSLRLRAHGWKLMFVPTVKSFHCRGWNSNRKSMPKKMRLHSAYNELTIHWRQKWMVPTFYSGLKYWAVKCFNL